MELDLKLVIQLRNYMYILKKYLLIAMTVTGRAQVMIYCLDEGAS